ncbi:hypothetical protein DFH06DRAFT_1178731 [Mycena polygramma]|nr:hypothetical protein DFH06DRAFT_1178731 [Mycena polygramma]
MRVDFPFFAAVWLRCDGFRAHNGLHLPLCPWLQHGAYSAKRVDGQPAHTCYESAGCASALLQDAESEEEVLYADSGRTKNAIAYARSFPRWLRYGRRRVVLCLIYALLVWLVFSALSAHPPDEPPAPKYNSAHTAGRGSTARSISYRVPSHLALFLPAEAPPVDFPDRRVYAAPAPPTASSQVIEYGLDIVGCEHHAWRGREVVGAGRSRLTKRMNLALMSSAILARRSSDEPVSLSNHTVSLAPVESMPACAVTGPPRHSPVCSAHPQLHAQPVLQPPYGRGAAKHRGHEAKSWARPPRG